METKTVYKYDWDGYYIGILILDDTDKSPSGRYNIPAKCTETEPPADKEGYKRKYNGTAWEYEEIPKEPEPPEPTLDELKTVKLAELKLQRDTAEVLPIEYDGNSYDYDEKARDRINAAIIALEMKGAEATIEWTLADNTSLTVTSKDLKMVIAAVAVRSNELHVKYRAASDKIDVAKTKEDLEKITLD